MVVAHQERVDSPSQFGIGRALTVQDGGAGRGLIAFDGGKEDGLNTLRVDAPWHGSRKQFLPEKRYLFDRSQNHDHFPFGLI